jgi:hypothetical protein
VAYNSPILGPSGVGLVGNDSKLTKEAREAFVAQVILLLAGGNLNGKGPKISSILGVPFPPVPGPKLIDPDRLIVKPTDPLGDLLWFDPSPLSVLMTPMLIDPEKDYQKLIVSTLYEPLVKMLNIPGNIVAPALFDPTAFFDVDIDLPELTAALPDPKLQAKLAVKYGLDVGLIAQFAADLPGLPAAPPVPPALPIPPLPDFDFIIFPDLFIGLLSIPIELLKPDFVISLISIPSPDPGELFLKIAGLALDILLKLLETLGLLLILPKLLVATIIIILQNLVSMMVCDIIGSVLGTGQVVKLAGTFLGLV